MRPFAQPFGKVMEVIMVETTRAADWNVMNFGNRDRLLEAIGDQAEEFFQLASNPENWEAPTASGHWQVRDIVGHIVDVTEGYLEAFDTARAGRDAPPPLGLRAMSELADRNAQSFRNEPQDTMVGRLRTDYEQMMEVFQSLTEDDWIGLMVPHKYMGPAPAFIFPTFQLVDYGVHLWDIREGLGLPNGVPGPVGDFLAPVMFSLWQGILDTDRLGNEQIDIGIRISGRNPGLFHVKASRDGLSFEPVDETSLSAPAVIEFDPGSLVLTAYDRIHGGTAYGDREMVDRFRSSFFTI
jgi:uncharacterized protein (TIGR03083 family)